MSTENFKATVLSRAKEAASGKAPVSCSDSCSRCHRVDLQLLVVTPSVVTDENYTVLKTAKYSWPPQLDAEFGKVPRTATAPVARIMRPGFLMVFFPAQGCWDVWQVMQYGLTRKIMHQVTAKKYGQMHSTFAKAALAEKICSLKAANFRAQMISIAGAGGIESAWMAFTDTLWTQTTLQHYAANPQVASGRDKDGKITFAPLRTLRGREINPKAILGGTVPAFGLQIEGDTLHQHVIDFVKAPSAKFRNAFKLAQKPLDDARQGKGAEFAAEIRRVEAKSGPAYLNRSLLIMVPDPIGVLELHNKLRTAVIGLKNAWMAGGKDVNGANPDPDRPWKRQSMLNAGYIRSWVLQAERQAQADSRVSVAVVANHTIDEATYQAILKDRPFNGANSKGKPYEGLFAPGIKLQPLEDTPKRYRIIMPDKQGAEKERAVIKGASGKLQRYNRHLSTDLLKTYNEEYLSHERGFHTMLTKRDTDYVTWLKHPATAAAIENDFDRNPARQDPGRDTGRLSSDMYDAFCLLNTTARCYGGGGMAEPSLTNLLEEINRDESDPKNRIGRAMVAKFDLVEKLKEEAGARADLYDAVDAVKKSYEELQGAWKEWSGPSASPATILAFAATEATARMNHLALNPQLASKPGLKYALKDAAKKQVVWFRAAALHKYLESGSATYYVSVAWDSRAFLSVAADQLTLHTPSLKLGDKKSFKKKAKGYERSKLQLKNFLTEYDNNKRVTIPVVFDLAKLEAMAGKFHEPMVEIVSHNMFGVPSGLTKIPKSMADALIVEQCALRNFSFKNFNLVGSLNFVVLGLQLHALKEAFDDISKKGGMAQVEAVAATLSAVTGVTGALVELSAMALAPEAVTAAGTPASATLASKIPAQLTMQYAAGLFMAGGALFDSAVSFARAVNAHAKGDADAMQYHVAGATTQLIGGISIGMGSYYAYRTALATRVGASVVLPGIAHAFSPLALARCLTGVGVILWLAGLAFTYYALYLEDDSNELYLRRSWFGSGHPELGKFTSLEEEMQFFEALSIGSTATLEWNDEMSGSDEIIAKISIIYPVEPPASAVPALPAAGAGKAVAKPAKPFRHTARVKLDGYSKIGGKLVHRFWDQEMPPFLPDPAKKDENGFITSTPTLNVPEGVGAVRMTYALFADKSPSARPVARGDLWIED